MANVAQALVDTIIDLSTEPQPMQDQLQRRPKLFGFENQQEQDDLEIEDTDSDEAFEAEDQRSPKLFDSSMFEAQSPRVVPRRSKVMQWQNEARSRSRSRRDAQQSLQCHVQRFAIPLFEMAPIDEEVSFKEMEVAKEEAMDPMDNMMVESVVEEKKTTMENITNRTNSGFEEILSDYVDDYLSEKIEEVVDDGETEDEVEAASNKLEARPEINEVGNSVTLNGVSINSVNNIADELELANLNEENLGKLFMKFLHSLQGGDSSGLAGTGTKIGLTEDNTSDKSRSQWFSAAGSPEVTYNVGTQINIASLSLDMSKIQQSDSSANEDDKKDKEALEEQSEDQDKENEKDAGSVDHVDVDAANDSAENDYYYGDKLKPNIILGSGEVNPNVLSKIIHGYYNQLDDGTLDAMAGNGMESREGSVQMHDRRPLQGKYKNSPMIIKLLEGNSLS